MITYGSSVYPVTCRVSYVGVTTTAVWLGGQVSSESSCSAIFLHISKVGFLLLSTFHDYITYIVCHVCVSMVDRYSDYFQFLAVRNNGILNIYMEFYGRVFIFLR